MRELHGGATDAGETACQVRRSINDARRPIALVLVLFLLLVSFAVQLAILDYPYDLQLNLYVVLFACGCGISLLLVLGWPVQPSALADQIAPSPPRTSTAQRALLALAAFMSFASAWVLYTRDLTTLSLAGWLVALLLIVVAAADLPARRPLSWRQLRSRYLRRSPEYGGQWLASTMVIVTGASLLRLPHLAGIPAYMYHDEASIGLAARALAAGHLGDVFTIMWANMPAPAFLWDGLVFRVFGDSLVSLRLSSALLGIGSILIVILLGEELFNRRTGLLTGALMAVFHYHIHFSRDGLSNIQPVFFVTLTIYCLLKSLRTRSRLGAVLTSLLLGIDFQIYYAGRVALILTPIIVLLEWAPGGSDWLRQRAGTVGWLIAGSVVSLAPAIAFALLHWGDFTLRTGEVTVLGGTADEQAYIAHMFGTTNPFVILRTSFWQVFQTFNFSGDRCETYLIQHPMLDPMSAALFPTALGLAALRIRHRGHAITLMCFCVILCTGGVLTKDQPCWERLVVVIPFLALLLGSLLDTIWRALEHYHMLVLPSRVAVILCLAVVGWGNYNWYFNDYTAAIRGNIGWALPLEVGRYLATFHDHPYVYGISDEGFYVTHEAVQFIAPNLTACAVVHNLSMQDCPPGPKDDLIFIITPSRAQLVPEIERLYPGGALRILRVDDCGHPALVYRVVHTPSR